MTRPAAVSVFGLGKLGLPMVAAFASKGFGVTGYDSNAHVVDALGAGRVSLVEPQLAETIAANRARIRAARDARTAVLETDATFVIVPTPSESDGGFSLDAVLSTCRAIGEALREKNAYHVVVLTSTVLPGDSEARVIPEIESASGKTCGAGFGFCYNPEFIALGSVIRDLLHPDFILIGESDERAGSTMAAFYDALVGAHVPKTRMRVAEAELAKITVNTFVTTKISYANMLAEICERIPNCDVATVLKAVGLDSRIGRKYFNAGLGYGGPCFPRDNAAFAKMARLRGAEPTLVEATDAVNRRQAARTAERVAQVTPKGGAVAVLGLAYKADTPVVEASQGFEIAAALASQGFRVRVHDPAALENVRAKLGASVSYAASVEDAIAGAASVIVATAWPEYKNLLNAARPIEPKAFLFDCWRLYDAAAASKIFDYLTPGTGPRMPQPFERAETGTC